MTVDEFYFLIESDIHASVTDDGEHKIYEHKENPDERFKRIHKKYPFDFVLCIGDLTEHGYDGKTGNIFESCISIQQDRNKNELKAFRDLYEKPIEEAGFKLYLCIGNHDMPPGHKGVGEYVRDKHKTTWPALRSKWYGGNYKFKHKGILFLCLGVYPNDLKWLQDNLPKKGEPVIIWYHYNTIVGERFADFWSTEAKSRFADVVDGHNVLCVCNGHSHSSKIGLYRNMYTVRGAGHKAAIVHIKNKKLKEVYFDSGKNDKISSFPQIKQFHKRRTVQSNVKKTKKYDEQNHNTIDDNEILSKN